MRDVIKNVISTVYDSEEQCMTIQAIVIQLEDR